MKDIFETLYAQIQQNLRLSSKPIYMPMEEAKLDVDCRLPDIEQDPEFQMRVMGDFERVMHERARRIDALVESVMPRWAFWVRSAKLPQWLKMRLLKVATRSVQLRIIENPMAEITEVWAHGALVGRVGTLDTMEKLGI